MGFPDGSVVKNPPANAGKMGSIPDPGRSHTGTKAPVPQPLSLCSRALQPQLLKPTHARACAPQQEKPGIKLEKASAATKTQHSQK